MQIPTHLNGRYVAKLADFGLSVHAYYRDFPADSERDVYYPLRTPLLNAPGAYSFQEHKKTYLPCQYVCRYAVFTYISNTFNKKNLTALFLDYTCLNLPDSLQRRALDELKMYATSSKPFEFFDSVRERAALHLAECHLIAFGTSYDLQEAFRWLLISKSYGNISSICLRRLPEVLGSPSPELVAKVKGPGLKHVRTMRSRILLPLSYI